MDNICKMRSSTASTNIALEASWRSLGKTRSPTLRFSHALTFPLFTPCSDSADYAGLVMLTKWRRDASLRTSCVVNLPLGRDQSDAHNCVSKTSVSAMWWHLISAVHTGRKWQVTGQGELYSDASSVGEKIGSRLWLKWRDHIEPSCL